MHHRIKELIEETVRTSLLEFSTNNVEVNIEDDTKKQTVASIPVEFCEKFAELIINECLKCFDTDHEGDVEYIKFLIKREFGVK
jgi:hypothetical protein